MGLAQGVGDTGASERLPGPFVSRRTVGV